MTISSRISERDGVVEIDVGERFDFAQQKDFRAVYRDCPPDLKYRVNLERVEYLDSAALGMLLLLRQHAGDENDSVTLCKAPEAVRNILHVANFERIFRIE